ncbi:MAG: GNAT family N-acetyltransferase [Anaerolineae bacterium]|nr:GNAT family N-acetyltransferase [Anaerolineae bacterium]
MASIVSGLLADLPKNIRPFDTRRDLQPAADLIELCFAETLTPDGRRYLQNMRRAARTPGSPYWAALNNPRGNFPLGGFVWEEDGEIIGNLNLIHFFHQGRRLNLIANVAVHPNYRRRGIAQRLTQAALEKTRRRRIHEVWLQARTDNPAALTLYQNMGFSPRARRTTWLIHPRSLVESATPAPGRATIRSQRHWAQQAAWLQANYPTDLRWHFPLKTRYLQPGLMGLLLRFFAEVQTRHWAAQHQGKLLGVLTWQASHTHADHLWLSASPQNEDQALKIILPFIRRELLLRRKLALDYPYERAQGTLMDAGFEPQHTLLWMKFSQR